MNGKNKKIIVSRIIYLKLAVRNETQTASCATSANTHLALRFFEMFYVFAKVVQRTNKNNSLSLYCDAHYIETV